MASGKNLYETHVSEGSTTAVFSFGSFVNPGRVGPSYAFMKTCLNLREKRGSDFDVYYFVAKKNDWYFGGVQGVGESIADAFAELYGIRARYSRAVFIGNSMGGFAALLFGYYCAADRIIAFSPQTRLDPDFLARHDDSRWKMAIHALQKEYDPRSLILEDALKQYAKEGIAADIYVGADCSQDMAHAETLRSLIGITIHQIPGEGHDLVHALRESGELEKAIDNAIG